MCGDTLTHTFLVLRALSRASAQTLVCFVVVSSAIRPQSDCSTLLSSTPKSHLSAIPFRPNYLLPSIRTTPAPPFSRTGVDFAGPFTLKIGHTCKPTHVKCYAAVFICMTTKAVHLDLCASLSTTDFLATLSRFTSRRGTPSHIFSDNGTNFQGAREDIRDLQRFHGRRETREAIDKFATENDINWHHTPPKAPHFGGLWEAAVKAMKAILRKNARPHPLRWEELYTLLVEAEAILNSRPIAPLHSEEAAEGMFLMAGHFLIGRPLRAPPTKTPPSGSISNLRR